jgi:beta-galactosidase GanA
LRLVLLWFGTWKNGSAHYLPEWMKRSPEKYPNLVGANGKEVDSPSPFASATLEADIRAFSALMTQLKSSDPDHTVIMVQVENEPGAWGSVRDHSPAAEKIFQSAVPVELLSALHKEPPSPGANWPAVFGEDADEFFHAWAVARYVGQVAAAGKAVYPLPLYTNAALRDPLNPGRATTYESGGPTDNVLPIWKAAAPALDLLAPDIYLSDSPRYFRVLELYRRADNPLFIPETGTGPAFARYFFAALGHGAIGFAPFGVDYTGYAVSPLGAPSMTEERLVPFALNYRVVAPMAREIAQLSFEGKLQAVCEPDDKTSQVLHFGDWDATISYGLSQFGPGEHPPGNPQPIGRALIAQLDPDHFLVTGFFCRVVFRPSGATMGKPWQFLRVEEGRYEKGSFKPSRIWNGDQTDWGLNFSSGLQVLRVSISVR